MNATRLLTQLAAVNKALKNTQYISADQRKVYRRAKSRLMKVLKQFTDPSAPARPLPPRTNQINIFSRS